MKEKLIFIHIPKTGGTSINCEINQTEWQTTPDFYYRHIDYKTKKSNSGDIFMESNHSKYKDFPIFFFMRNPIERLFSEYYFLKPRKEFMSLLPRTPRSFYEYCKFKNTQNSIIKFLLGHRMYSNPILNESVYSQLIERIETLNIKIGIFEDYVRSLVYLEKELNISWNETIQKKRITIDKPSYLELSNEEYDEIKELNSFDFKLYEYAVKILNESNVNLDTANIVLSGSRYDYIEKYTQRFILIETIMTQKGKTFLAQNKSFFAKLNLSLHRKKLRGQEYVRAWNSAFRASLVNAIDDHKTLEKLENISSNCDDPLQESFALAKLINTELNKSTHAPKINRLN
ncbi:sulfotransferase family protein [Parvicella tangerina]|uniref:Sulfotransferase family protein n=1 Tax=Parvicella tangerina TaxID=2829795 RepID=A0A916JPZ2_9FLAO|nr:sulfotransferase family protein [Parvicella tangerina]CAG5086344.1 hypothetical protein CRYO30217_03089 [Parvicella tangerina]